MGISVQQTLTLNYNPQKYVIIIKNKCVNASVCMGVCVYMLSEFQICWEVDVQDREETEQQGSKRP